VHIGLEEGTADPAGLGDGAGGLVLGVAALAEQAPAARASAMTAVTRRAERRTGRGGIARLCEE
jgi:hypothetical protein